MKAIILAAGQGTRLRPLTLHLPKVLAPLNGTPLLQITLNWLRNHGIHQIAINLHHLSDQILDFCGDGSRFGVSITYSKESNLLGTAGGVKQMEDFFDDTFLVVYGDILTDLNLSQMLKFHKLKKGIATAAVKKFNLPTQVGVVCINREHQITDFVEKPQTETNHGKLANGAVYILEKEILHHIPANKLSDFGYDIFPTIINSGLDIYGYILGNHEYLTDIGSWGQYEKAIKDVKAKRVKI
jgi:NDP-sugar pyrophosphorylase family protein